MISTCKKNQFTCRRNGRCISIVKRCDLVSDCPDNSDEVDCSLVSIPPGYTTGLAPPPVGNEDVLFHFKLVITSIREFDLSGFQVSIDVVSIIKWIDPRVDFNGLRDHPHINKVKRLDSIWLPEFYIEDSSQSPSDVIIRTSDLTVLKESEALPRDLSSLNQGE